MTIGRFAAGAVAAARAAALVTVPTCALGQTTEAVLAPQRQVLNIVREVMPTPHDRMSTVDEGEAKRYPSLGPTYYLPGGAVPGTVPLYRLLGDRGEHSADLHAVPGATVEGTLGYPWTAATRPPGSSPVWSVLDPKTGDHGLAAPEQTPRGYSASALPGVYAWPRYGADQPLLTLRGKQITITSNLAAGGALWSLEWKGQQFIDQVDYGRLVQSSLSFSGAGASAALPTEGGDQTADPDPKRMHGSPLLSAANATTSQGVEQHTRAIPLEWLHTRFDGGHSDQVVAYPGWQLGKDVTLDDAAVQLGTDRPQWQGQVMRYETVFVNGGPPLHKADIEIPTAYLKPAFRRAYTCDATQEGPAALREVSASQFTQLHAGTWHYQFDMSAGGVILANDSLTHALGIYGSRPELGGSVRYFTLWRFGALAQPSVNKSSAGGGLLTLETGANRFQSWIVVGQAPEVCAIMHRMYAQGLK